MNKRRALAVAMLMAALWVRTRPLISEPAIAGTPGIAPASQPADRVAPQTPAEQLALWQDEFDQWDADQAITAYTTHNSTEHDLAHSFAVYGIDAQRLTKLARERWGADAEQAVAHACGTDCRADDATAQVTVNGEHAKIVFKSDDIDDLLMVRENGAWKIDTGAYVQMLGAKTPELIHATDQCSQVVEKALSDMKSGKYAAADDLAKDVRAKLAPLIPQ
jgi:hypothetical protein